MDPDTCETDDSNDALKNLELPDAQWSQEGDNTIRDCVHAIDYLSIKCTVQNPVTCSMTLGEIFEEYSEGDNAADTLSKYCCKTCAQLVDETCVASNKEGSDFSDCNHFETVEYTNFDKGCCTPTPVALDYDSDGDSDLILLFSSVLSDGVVLFDNGQFGAGHS